MEYWRPLHTRRIQQSNLGKEVRGISPEELSRIEREMTSQARELRFITESHGRNALHLVVVVRYLERIMRNGRVTRYLIQRYPEIQVELQKLVETSNLADGCAT